MLHLAQPSGEGGQAADTGSAMHMAAAEWHRGKEVAAALESMSARRAEYPLADLSDAAAMFLLYSSDPRNRTAKVVLVEQPVAFSIAPLDPSDPPISVVGTVDQVREDHTGLKVWDIKTSKKDPDEVRHSAILQLAAYCVGCTVLLGRPVSPGGFIMPRLYKQTSVATSPVFRHVSWKFSDLEQLMFRVRHAVHNIRRGILWHNYSPDCRWCHMRSPDVCLPELVKLNARNLAGTTPQSI